MQTNQTKKNDRYFSDGCIRNDGHTFKGRCSEANQTKEGWEEIDNKQDRIVELREAFMPRITKAIQNTQGGYEDREDLRSVISDLIIKVESQTEQRVAREMIDELSEKFRFGMEKEINAKYIAEKIEKFKHQYNIE